MKFIILALKLAFILIVTAFVSFVAYVLIVGPLIEFIGRIIDYYENRKIQESFFADKDGMHRAESKADNLLFGKDES